MTRREIRTNDTNISLKQELLIVTSTNENAPFHISLYPFHIVIDEKNKEIQIHF